MKITLEKPDQLRLTGMNGETYTGGSQEWYEDRWHRLSGCGSVAAVNLIWYIRRMRGGFDDYLELMREMYAFVTPGPGGINTSGLFTGGLLRYGEKRGLQIVPRVLEIPANRRRRPDTGMVGEFITSALREDAPTAFLNLSNGTLENLEHWHWVTIIALNTETRQAELSDYGKVLNIDISEWLKTSRLGGAFVELRVESGELRFTDVAADAPYCDAVIWAYENGVVNGTTDTTFSPDATITREQITTMFWRYADKVANADMATANDLSGFTDADKLYDYAVDSMKWAVGAGLITGATATTIAPKNTATRAEAAAMIMRLTGFIG